jgi:hypothetical protein
MTNEELFAALKTEIGWLRNELTRLRVDYEQIRNDLNKIKTKVTD